MDQVLERISTWEAAGLIDPATAARLRLAEAERAAGDASARRPASDVSGDAADMGPSSLGMVFGPGVTIGEMFAYLGGAFLLGAYETFVARAAGTSSNPGLGVAFGAATAAIVSVALGFVLVRGDARRSRAAGVLFALAVVHAGAAGAAAAGAANVQLPGSGVIGGLAASVVAIGLRRLHPSLLTQVALLASLTALTGSALSWLEGVISPNGGYVDPASPVQRAGPDPLLLVVGSAACWLALAIGFGLLGLREARAASEPAAGHRASLTRLWAGLVAVIGLSMSVFRSGYAPNGDYHRIVEPWIGDLAILVLAAVLVERAFRRDAGTFVYAAALGLIIALSDFNFTYLSSSTEVGLLIEGIILLGAGVGADRLRRRLARDRAAFAIPFAPA